MRDLRGLRRTTAGVLVATALLTGCSEKQGANDTLPSPSAAETSEALPEIGPADFPVPDEARTKDAAGAEAFVRYYIELINRTSEIPDADPLRQFSAGCEDCDRIASFTEEAATLGNDPEGGQITIVEVGRPLMGADTAELPIRIDQAEFVVLNSAGSPTDGGSPAFSNVLGGVALEWDGNRHSWLVTDLTFG
ncbi:hypothetical protein [Blastococcus colisei]|uniref:hypothetical protein n=1 Tax=Blastococcus colisei TaxID=1564162 RepID=UPI0011517E19|nr:hypothetical protein [Blastococcus colisei]